MKTFTQFEKPFGNLIASLGFSNPLITQDSGLWQATYIKGDIELLVMNDLNDVFVVCIISRMSPIKNYGLNVLYDFIKGLSYQHTYYDLEILISFLKQDLVKIESLLNNHNHVETKARLDSFIDDYYKRTYPETFNKK